MKTRQGFVSNSSSSSFIVGFDRKPESAEELCEILFDGDNEYPNPHYCPDDDWGGVFNIKSWPAQEVANVVWTDLKDQQPRTEDDVRDELSHGWFEGHPDLDWSEVHDIEREAKKHGVDVHRGTPSEDMVWVTMWDDAFHRMNEKYMKESEVFQDKVWGYMKYRFVGKQMFIFEYEDHTPLGSAMEHGTLFDNLPHIRISKH